jgi:hypothetical protein
MLSAQHRMHYDGVCAEAPLGSAVEEGFGFDLD